MNWQLEQKKLVSRTRRTPSQSVLYQICFNLSQELENNFEEKYQAQYGYYRKSITEALDKYLNCGILKHGCARAICENCEHEELIAFSCKQRGLCPSCESKRAHIFAEHLNKNVLLAHPKVHVVFTIPKRLRIYFKYQRELLKKLYKAANLAWQAQVEEEHPDSETGAVMALHTAGELLNWHPHIHAVCLLGGIEQGEFRQLSYIDLKYLTRCFRDQVLEFLLKAELIDELVVENLKAQEHSGFNVWAGETIHSDQVELSLYISRYLKKSTINLTRLELINKKGEQYVRIKSKTNANLAEHRELKALDFLAEVTQHIPNKWEQTTRYYGVYSARYRGANKSKAQNAEAIRETKLEPKEPSIKLSSHWAKCMKQVFELDPLECPKCGNQMKIKNFPQSPKEIEALCKSLKIESWIPPPKFVMRKTA